MYASIIGLAEEPFDEGAFHEELPQNDTPAWHYQAFEDLSGEAKLVEGRALVSVDRTDENAFVQGDAIVTEEIDATERVATDFIVDLGAPWMGIETSAAAKLFDLFALKFGAHAVRRAEVDIDGVIDTLNPSEVWQVGWAADEPDEDEEVGYAGATARYHDDAELRDRPPLAEYNQLGFRTMWDNSLVRGTIASSGYVAMFDGATSREAFAAFVRDVVLPNASMPDTDQQDLDEVAADA